MQRYPVTPHMTYVARMKRLQAEVEAVSAAGQAALFTHNLEQMRAEILLEGEGGRGGGL